MLTFARKVWKKKKNNEAGRRRDEKRQGEKKRRQRKKKERRKMEVEKKEKSEHLFVTSFLYFFSLVARHQSLSISLPRQIAPRTHLQNPIKDLNATQFEIF